jgi:hypothetical protein
MANYKIELVNREGNGGIFKIISAPFKLIARILFAITTSTKGSIKSIKKL